MPTGKYINPYATPYAKPWVNFGQGLPAFWPGQQTPGYSTPLDKYGNPLSAKPIPVGWEKWYRATFVPPDQHVPLPSPGGVKAPGYTPPTVVKSPYAAPVAPIGGLSTLRRGEGNPLPVPYDPASTRVGQVETPQFHWLTEMVKRFANPLAGGAKNLGSLSALAFEDKPEQAYSYWLGQMNWPETARRWLQSQYLRYHGQYLGSNVAQGNNMKWLEYLGLIDPYSDYMAQSPAARGERPGAFTPKTKFLSY